MNSFCPPIRGPSPTQPPPLRSPSMPSAPLPPLPLLLSKLSAEASGAHRSQGPGEGKAPAAPRAFGFFKAGFAGAWSPMMPALILRLDSVASTASADPSRSPIQGAAPHLPRSWNAKSLRQMAGAGRARVEWQPPLLREEARESAWFSDWDKLVGRGAGAVHRAVGAEPGTPADRLLPRLQATPSPTLRAAGPSSLAGPYQLDKGVWYRTWERVLRLPPGRPFRRDFGDFYSFRPNYFPLFPTKIIF